MFFLFLSVFLLRVAKIDDRVAFTYRVYEKTAYEIGLQVQDGTVQYYDIKITK